MRDEPADRYAREVIQQWKHRAHATDAYPTRFELSNRMPDEDLRGAPGTGEAETTPP